MSQPLNPNPSGLDSYTKRRHALLSEVEAAMDRWVKDTGSRSLTVAVIVNQLCPGADTVTPDEWELVLKPRYLSAGWNYAWVDYRGYQRRPDGWGVMPARRFVVSMAPPPSLARRAAWAIHDRIFGLSPSMPAV